MRNVPSICGSALLTNDGPSKTPSLAATVTAPFRSTTAAGGCSSTVITRPCGNEAWRLQRAHDLVMGDRGEQRFVVDREGAHLRGHWNRARARSLAASTPLNPDDPNVADGGDWRLRDEQVQRGRGDHAADEQTRALRPTPPASSPAKVPPASVRAHTARAERAEAGRSRFLPRDPIQPPQPDPTRNSMGNEPPRASGPPARARRRTSRSPAGGRASITASTSAVRRTPCSR